MDAVPSCVVASALWAGHWSACWTHMLWCETLSNMYESTSGILWINEASVCLLLASEEGMQISSLWTSGMKCNSDCYKTQPEELSFFFFFLFFRLNLVCASAGTHRWELFTCQMNGDTTVDPEMWARAAVRRRGDFCFWPLCAVWSPGLRFLPWFLTCHLPDPSVLGLPAHPCFWRVQTLFPSQSVCTPDQG